MIGGHVTRHRWAIVTIELIDTSGGIVQVDAVVDTGFTGDLTLPPEMILRLGLKFVGRGEAVVGDGMIDVFDVYSGEVFWDGQQRRIEIDETRIEPLIGMGLLHGYRLTIDVVADGEVRLERLQGLT